ERHAALEVEPQLQIALRATQHLVQENVVSLLEISQRLLQANIRKVLREIDPAIARDLLERDEFAERLAVVLERDRLRHERVELARFGGRVSRRVVDEGLVFQRKKGARGPHHNGEADGDLPEVASEHGCFGFKSVTPPQPRRSMRRSVDRITWLNSNHFF